MLDIRLIEDIRTRNPLVHCITNFVAANFVANGLLALGASPFMAEDEPEMDEVATFADVLSLNLGHLNAHKWQAIIRAYRAYHAQKKPILLDPVGCGATAFRREKTQNLLKNSSLTAIRGNAGEMACLADYEWNTKGVDAGSGDSDLIRIAQTVAKRYGTIAVLTGEQDIVTNGEKTIVISGGSHWLPRITGSGCLHGALCSAFLACSQDPLSALVTACAFYSVCAEKAAQRTLENNGASGTFLSYFLDALSQVSADDVNQCHQIMEIK